MSGEGEYTGDYRESSSAPSDFSGFPTMNVTHKYENTPEQIPPKVEVAKGLLMSGMFIGGYGGSRETRLYDKLIQTVMEYYDIPEEAEAN